MLLWLGCCDADEFEDADNGALDEGWKVELEGRNTDPAELESSGGTEMDEGRFILEPEDVTDPLDVSDAFFDEAFCVMAVTLDAPSDGGTPILVFVSEEEGVVSGFNFPINVSEAPERKLDALSRSVVFPEGAC